MRNDPDGGDGDGEKLADSRDWVGGRGGTKGGESNEEREAFWAEMAWRERDGAG